MTDLLIATTNSGKLREIEAMLTKAEIALRVLSLKDVRLDHVQVEEPFDTFAENAAVKAREFAQLSGLPALADDSGLCVDALDGRPGVLTARYAGDGASDSDRYHKLLRELDSLPDAPRSAYFLCAAALAHADSLTLTEGRVHGMIAQQASSSGHGFGFDPVFVPQGYTVTLANIPMAEKAQFSHRGLAIRAMLPHLRQL
jgi:XTP/dITP diphosphohydrolase